MMNGFLAKLAMGLATAGVIGAVGVYAQVQVVQQAEKNHADSEMHSGARRAVEGLRKDVAEVDKKAALNEAYLKAIAEKVGAKVEK